MPGSPTTTWPGSWPGTLTGSSGTEERDMSEGHAAPALTGDQIDRILGAMADSFGRQLRSPVLHWPSEQDLDYQDITFPALDGVPLEGWFIPAAGPRCSPARRPGLLRPGASQPWR